MGNIFKKQKDYVQKPNRNNFDLSFNNNFTCRIGQIVPLLCKEVIPGDKFNINCAAGLRALPLVFPVQTPMQAQFSFFYVRNRTLWKDWEDFYFKTKDGLEHPYISIPYTRADEIATGTLADFLGVPTTYADQTGVDFLPANLLLDRDSLQNLSSDQEQIGTISPDGDNQQFNGTIRFNPDAVAVRTYLPATFYWLFTSGNSQFGQQMGNYRYVNTGLHNPNLGSSAFMAWHTGKIECNFNGFIRFNSTFSPSSLRVVFSKSNPDFDDYDHSIQVFTVDCSTSQPDAANFPELFELDLTSYKDIILRDVGTSFYITLGYSAQDESIVDFLDSGEYNLGNVWQIQRFYVSNADVSPLNNPFVVQSGETQPDIKLSALPFRAYESIFNAWFRNSNGVDPFILNGVPEYNRYCTNLNGGADSTTPLYLRYRNYELDFLTSATTTPQAGIAPLVGVSATGVFTFKDENDQTFKLYPQISNDGHTLTGIDSYDDGLPIGSVMRLTDMIRFGVSINDFRNVNSLQRWCENSLRRGFRYSEQLLAHFGVSPSYKDLLMPEYLGGFDREISVQQINATAETADMSLGDYAGQAGLFAQNKHSINHYFDEAGFVICVMCIVPIPNYSQLLDKKFIKENVLSYYFPEFRNIGMQPINYQEVTPIQAKLHNKSYYDVFGYQRPYYDLIASVDEAHSKMRTDLQGFLITRNFGQPPQLGHNFIQINPDEMTNPFVEEPAFGNDQFIGQVHFDIKAKRPISKIHLPRLE